MSFIGLQGISIRYGQGAEVVTAVESLDLAVEENEFLCLLGPSGCGKSTVLKGIAGLVNMQAGTASFSEAAGGPSDRLMVWQEPTLMPWRTVIRNVTYPLELAGVSKDVAKEKALKQLHLLGIGDFAEKYPRQLSGGMRQRVGIARALVADPKVLLMDEPFAALDAQTRRLLQDQLLALWNELDRTVVFVTHSVEEAILLGDRIAVMTARPGQLKEMIQVPFERPRVSEIRYTTQYRELEQRIWDLLHAEAEKADAEVDDER